MSGVTTITEQNGYAIHQIVTRRFTVKEFVSSDGKVFAFSWQGSTGPNLKQLLGKYSAEIKSAIQAQGKVPAQRFRSIKSANIELHWGGLLRHHGGSACLGANFPAGLKCQDIH